MTQKFPNQPGPSSNKFFCFLTCRLKSAASRPGGKTSQRKTYTAYFYGSPPFRDTTVRPSSLPLTWLDFSPVEDLTAASEPLPFSTRLKEYWLMRTNDSKKGRDLYFDPFSSTTHAIACLMWCAGWWRDGGGGRRPSKGWLGGREAWTAGSPLSPSPQNQIVCPPSLLCHLYTPSPPPTRHSSNSVPQFGYILGSNLGHRL